MTQIVWTNPSVKQLAGDMDPISKILEKARSLVFDAIDNGWKGPPFDPISLAEQLGLSVIPKEDILDARLIPRPVNTQIEYNPNRSRTRIRFSIAHEIAHTLFPDYKSSIRNRSRKPMRDDEWQLELLCNVAAGEILMPLNPEMDFQNSPITMNKLLEIKRKYDVSMEAVLLRMIKITNQSITVFAAAREKESEDSSYRIDYVINSPTSTLNLKSGARILPDSILSECTAAGFTAKRREKWFDDMPELDIECIGVSPYPGHIYPRVLGIVRTKVKSISDLPSIRYLMGDATEPRGTGNKIVAHIVNDESKKWGRGFGLTVSKKWPVVRAEFVKWVSQKNLKLGNSHLVNISDDLMVLSMVAQQGYGPSPTPRLRYKHLRTCLEFLSMMAQKNSATVHMPRIGTGYAGGDWRMISELIDEILIKHGIEVTVYDLPGREKPKMSKSILEFIADDMNM